jgi:hypothetical protein
MEKPLPLVVPQAAMDSRAASVRWRAASRE